MLNSVNNKMSFSSAQIKQINRSEFKIKDENNFPFKMILLNLSLMETLKKNRSSLNNLTFSKFAFYTKKYIHTFSTLVRLHQSGQAFYFTLKVWLEKLIFWPLGWSFPGAFSLLTIEFPNLFASFARLAAVFQVGLFLFPFAPSNRLSLTAEFRSLALAFRNDRILIVELSFNKRKKSSKNFSLKKTNEQPCKLQREAMTEFKHLNKINLQIARKNIIRIDRRNKKINLKIFSVYNLSNL
ncbi:hypothetical protein BpHYR1_010972 [Brachionus plicatilis]|uniref:Uncharacterized protein n=1 Tax=Brachionus plicatilis TaxID=10195 RepID=A0A3M7T0X2_BRAPC|nr:hypothetical protein BpHYR1_010972 [Brachionus plicatilis]